MLVLLSFFTSELKIGFSILNNILQIRNPTIFNAFFYKKKSCFSADKYSYHLQKGKEKAINFIQNIKP